MAHPTPKAKSPFRRWKRRFFDALFRFLGAPLIGGLFYLLARTVRMRYTGFEHFQAALASGRPVILAFFHEDLLSIFTSHIHVHPCRVGVMLSQSRDGDNLAGVISRYDLVPIRASASRGAVRGFFELYHWLLTRRDYPSVVAVALDGPRGPRRVAKTGSAMLARKAGALIVPVAFQPGRALTFRSWDRMMLTAPFATLTAHVHPPIDAAVWNPDDDAANARRLSEILSQIKIDAGLP